MYPLERWVPVDKALIRMANFGSMYLRQPANPHRLALAVLSQLFRLTRHCRLLDEHR